MLVNPCCCSAPPYTCEGCTITQAPLVVSWVNPTLGDGSVVITYVPAGSQWTGSVPGQIGFTLRCVNVGGPRWVLSATAVGGSTCERFGLIGADYGFTAYTCSPFLLEYTVNSAGSPRCPSQYSLGYRKFTVTL